MIEQKVRNILLKLWAPKNSISLLTIDWTIRIDFWLNRENYIKQYSTKFIYEKSASYLSKCFLSDSNRIKYFKLKKEKWKIL